MKTFLARRIFKRYLRKIPEINNQLRIKSQTMKVTKMKMSQKFMKSSKKMTKAMLKMRLLMPQSPNCPK